MAKRVMFYCQHVLGMGHLVRSTEVVRALAESFSVLFVVGGEIPAGFDMPEQIEILELPALKTAADFSNLQSCDPSLDLEVIKTIRRDLLLRVYDQFQPDVLVTELFPFGRKRFSFELFPLLERAHSCGQHSRPLVVCSLRDILVARDDQEEYEDRVCQIINAFYDLVLVHGDGNIQRLEETFLRALDLHCAVEYTGYVVRKQSTGAGSEIHQVAQDTVPTIIVSNGGGQTPEGHVLLECTLRAAAVLQGEIPHQFCVFTGPFMPESAYMRLQELARDATNVTLSSYTPHLSAHLAQADLSISMAGYNTIMDVLTAGVRALVYPFTGGGNQEQTHRANRLAALGVLTTLQDGQLTPDQLAAIIQTSLNSSLTRVLFNNRGAANSNYLLREHLTRRSLVARPHDVCLRQQTAS